MSIDTRTSINTVVFDLGGVLIDWDPRYLYRRLMPEDEVDAFLDEIGFESWNHAQDAGGSWADAVAAHAALHPHRRELIEAYPARFVDTLGGPIAGTVAVLEELHAAGVRLLALSNWSAETFQVARREYAFLDLFDGIVVSGEEQVAKPDPRIFAILIERHRLDAGRTVFIDDSAANITAARTAGLVTIHFESPGRLREQLVQVGLLPPVPPALRPPPGAEPA
jgi:2-haloacid dehalogenase